MAGGTKSDGFTETIYGDNKGNVSFGTPLITKCPGPDCPNPAPTGAGAPDNTLLIIAAVGFGLWLLLKGSK